MSATVSILNPTTWLTVVSTTKITPHPVTLRTTLTVLVQGSGAQTYGVAPTHASSHPASTTGEGPNTTVGGTIPVISSLEPTSTYLPSSPTHPAALREGTPKSTIVLSTLIPLLAILGAVVIWRVARGRKRATQIANGTSDVPHQDWIARASKLWPGRKKTGHELPWEVSDVEHDAKDGGRSETARSTHKHSPFPSTFSSPSRPPRPVSITRSLLGAMQDGSPDSYVGRVRPRHDDDVPSNNSTSRTGVLSNQSPTVELRPEDRQQAYDGTRRVFYETALNRNLPFDRLARPSLCLERHDDANQERSLTPEPLRIVKNPDSCTTIGDFLNASQGEMARRAFTEPRNLSQHLPRNQIDSLEEDLMDELNSIGGDGPIDEETRRLRREQTLKYLEGVLPMSPLPVNPASSMYSRDEWGSTIASQEIASPATAVHDAASGRDHRESEGKGKAIDRSGVEGGWI